jgi:hypothetical protein
MREEKFINQFSVSFIRTAECYAILQWGYVRTGSRNCDIYMDFSFANVPFEDLH